MIGHLFSVGNTVPTNRCRTLGVVATAERDGRVPLKLRLLRHLRHALFQPHPILLGFAPHMEHGLKRRCIVHGTGFQKECVGL